MRLSPFTRNKLFLSNKIPIALTLSNTGLLRCNALLLFVFITMLSVSCHKEKGSADIENVTGFIWTVYTIQGAGDSFINPIPTDWQFQLNSDRSFSFRLGSSYCSGTYTWTALDSANASVMFTVKEWNSPPQFSVTAEKLKNIVTTINRCSFVKSPSIPQFPSPPLPASMELQFKGNGGYFNVYRQ